MNALFRVAYLSMMALLFAAAGHTAAYCNQNGGPEGMHFEVEGDHIYVMPHDSPCMKIKKESGKIVWKTRLARASGFTSPVFIDGRFFTIEIYDRQLLSVDCRTGRYVVERKYWPGCGFAGYTPFCRPLVYDDLLIAVSDTYIEAFSLTRKSLAWELTCKSGDVIWVYDYFVVGDSLYILTYSPVDEKAHGHWINSAASDIPGQFEMVRLDCSTGKVLNRFDKNIFVDNPNAGMGWAKQLGEWNGKRLIFSFSRNDAGEDRYRLFGFDPEKQSVVTLVERLDSPSRGGKRQEIDRPVIGADTIFYKRYIESTSGMLFAKNLANGETLWDAETREIPFAAAEGKVLTAFAQRRFYRIYCRDALTGKVDWIRKLPRFSLAVWGVHEIKVSEGRLYVLTDHHLWALDLASGDEVWKTQLRPIQVDEQQAHESTWNGILDFFDDFF